MTRYETEAISLVQEKIEDDIYGKARFISSLRAGRSYDTTHPQDTRFEAKHARQSYNALRRFPPQGPDKKLKGQDATSVLLSVLILADKQIKKELDVESVELPGVPEDADVMDLPAMKAGDVRRCVASIAAHIEKDPDELLEAATASARLNASSAELKAEQVESEIDVMSRERILPDDKTLEKIARYEAHLSRQLYQTLHELENLQKHRGPPGRACR